ncbi:MAG: tetratricopeptide repeat protein [Deltaproteobacteria bacterium]|nr:tetratricopeptide repeat protein [Deltaproteobacteria bacterium]
MGKKKKDRSPESMLARAEKLFSRGNYPLAKKEFEKVLRGRFQPVGLPGRSKGPSGPESERMVERKDISERIEICNKEIKRLKAEDLIRRARKYSGNGNPREALRCFEGAYGISGEDWIREKIGRLREILLVDDLRKAARDAEVTGEYLKAAELYEQAFMAQERKDLLVRKAVCLVKAEKHSEAVSLLQDLTLSDPRSMYHYGFALAKVGRYLECLKIWDGIESQDNCFLAQKRAVRSLLAANLHDRFSRAENFFTEVVEGDKVRRELIRRGEDLIKSKVKSGDKSTEGALIFWDLERRLVEDLHGLIGDQEDFADLVCTPSFASRFGKSAQILQVIREKRCLFRNLEHYLETGSYYSTAWKSLYYLEGKDYENALASLPETEDGDEFLDYSVKKVKFSWGLHQLGKGEDPPKQYGETATALFDMAPRYEKQFIENALNAHELDKMRCYEKVLRDIHRKRPSKQIKEVLSLVMSSCAIELYNQGMIIPRSLEITLTEALGLSPENELACGNLNDLHVFFKVQELEQAISKNKMNKACKMAAETEYHEVRDHFFEFLEDAVESLDEMHLGYEDEIALLRNIHKWCSRVDDAHPILYDIEDMLAHLEQR